MEYPGAKFTRPVRRAMLWFFIALFFIISPALIMYTAGYRFDMRNGLLRETGSLSIDIEPDAVKTYLNNIKLKDEMPIRLKNITPGNYDVRLTASGYFDWIKSVEVKNKQTAYIKEISLIKKANPELLNEGHVSDLALSPDGNYLAYIIRRGHVAEIWLWPSARLASEEARSVSKGALKVPEILTRFESGAPLSMAWSPRDYYLAVSNSRAPYSRLNIINTKRPEWNFDLTKNGKETIDKFQWNMMNGRPELIFENKQKIRSLALPALQERTISGGKYIDWYMEENRLWTLVQNTSTGKIALIKDALGFPSEFQILKTASTGAAPENNRGWRILAAKENAALLKRNGASEMKLLTPRSELAIAAEQFLISRYNNWWLFWTPWELWSYSDGEEPYLLNRSGEQLRFVVPLDKYNTLGLAWTGKATALYPYYLVTHKLFDGDIKAINADPERRTLYFAGTIKEKEGLWRLSY